eukprot:TRINITY_DN3211_c1_g9_i1.p1 TRINITY_DN3211_c1_g9~~TRINITY_DN3211_c1_g9_i1.p1  ORF type:complete len:73 (+),score=13.74 TRINITY_DN3211_c1_g9_i1:259-477(+)
MKHPSELKVQNFSVTRPQRTGKRKCFQNFLIDWQIVFLFGNFTSPSIWLESTKIQLRLLGDLIDKQTKNSNL